MRTLEISLKLGKTMGNDENTCCEKWWEKWCEKWLENGGLKSHGVGLLQPKQHLNQQSFIIFSVNSLIVSTKSVIVSTKYPSFFVWNGHFTDLHELPRPIVNWRPEFRDRSASCAKTISNHRQFSQNSLEKQSKTHSEIKENSRKSVQKSHRSSSFLRLRWICTGCRVPILL